MKNKEKKLKEECLVLKKIFNKTDIEKKLTLQEFAWYHNFIIGYEKESWKNDNVKTYEEKRNEEKKLKFACKVLKKIFITTDAEEKLSEKEGNWYKNIIMDCEKQLWAIKNTEGS